MRRGIQVRLGLADSVLSTTSLRDHQREGGAFETAAQQREEVRTGMFVLVSRVASLLLFIVTNFGI